MISIHTPQTSRYHSKVAQSKHIFVTAHANTKQHDSVEVMDDLGVLGLGLGMDIDLGNRWGANDLQVTFCTYLVIQNKIILPLETKLMSSLWNVQRHYYY